MPAEKPSMFLELGMWGAKPYRADIMSDTTHPKISPVPFIFADLLFLGLAAYIVYASDRPLAMWQTIALLVAVAGGAWCSFIPFVRQFRADVQLAELSNLTTVVAQIQGMEAVARQIQLATGQWQTVHEQASKTSGAAKEVAERMTLEIRSFSAFMEKADGGEKQHLHLEIEKFRRGEGEWVQACVRILDHVFALYTAALRSSQPALIEQIGQFQNACLEALRRVGLNAFAARSEEPFNPEHHNLPPDASGTAPGTALEGTIALGITFQGQIIRKPMVAPRAPSKLDSTAGTETDVVPQHAAPMVSSDCGPSIPLPPEDAGSDKKTTQGEPPRPSSSVALEKIEGTVKDAQSGSAAKPPPGSIVEQELF